MLFTVMVIGAEFCVELIDLVWVRRDLFQPTNLPLTALDAGLGGLLGFPLIFISLFNITHVAILVHPKESMQCVNTKNIPHIYWPFPEAERESILFRETLFSHVFVLSELKRVLVIVNCVTSLSLSLSISLSLSVF